MIIDSHVHYGGKSTTYKVYSVDDLVAVAKEAGTDKIVQVTPRYEGDNDVSVREAARHPEGVFAVFGLLDFTAPDAEERVRKIASQPGMLGFRVQSRSEPGKSTLADPHLLKVLALCEKLGVVLQVYAPFEAEETQALARRFPALRVLVDHMGLRYEEHGGDNTQIFRQWPQLLKLALEPNVWIKVSYFPEAGRDFDPYPYPTAQRYFKELYETAGAKKLIWGSNFSPVLRACSYRESLDFVRVHCKFISKPDLDAILGGNFVANFTPKIPVG